MFRIVSLNLNGIRSAAKKGAFEWLQTIQADVVCLQELKAQLDDIPELPDNPIFSARAFHPAEKKGYSGVGLLADFGDLSIVSLYLPSGSSSDERQQAKFRCMEAIWPRLQALANGGREVVICGDWNIAHTEMDLKNWKSNQKNSGFLPEERAWLSRLFAEQGWVDVHRKLAPAATGTGKTATIAWLAERLQRPMLVMQPNKTLQSR